MDKKDSKTIWIFNHYATDTFFDRGGRHYNFAKYLMRDGYDVRIFCASTVHNTDINIDIPYGVYKEDIADGIPYTFVKAPPYKGNGKSRIKNMVSYYKRLFKVCKDQVDRRGKPDIIIASSVHPLTLVAGIKIAKRLEIPCICEIRDLWPESLVAYDIISQNHPLTKAMIKGEKWIYKKADALIFTMPDGYLSIEDKGWDSFIDMNKVYNINNGVDLENYSYNVENNITTDSDLDDNSVKIIYTGSIRKANSVSYLLDVAEKIKQHEMYKIIVYGDGDELDRLKTEKKKRELTNIVFKGRVEKSFVPYILSKSSLNIISGETKKELSQYGLSLNKMFEYMASGKPILATIEEGRTKIIDNPERPIGVARIFDNVDELVDALKSIINDKELYSKMSYNAKEVAKEYDFKQLTKKLENVVERLV